MTQKLTLNTHDKDVVKMDWDTKRQTIQSNEPKLHKQKTGENTKSFCAQDNLQIKLIVASDSFALEVTCW